MAKKYVFSTLSSSVDYGVYAKGGGDLPEKTGNIIIHGGANIPDKYMRTPYGVATPVEEEELEQLMQSPVFKLHMDNGFITVRDKPADADKVAGDMEGREPSAPLVDQDFTEAQQPTTNKPADETAPTKTGGRRA